MIYECLTSISDSSTLTKTENTTRMTCCSPGHDLVRYIDTLLAVLLSIELRKYAQRSYPLDTILICKRVYANSIVLLPCTASAHISSNAETQDAAHLLALHQRRKMRVKQMQQLRRKPLHAHHVRRRNHGNARHADRSCGAPHANASLPSCRSRHAG